MTENSPTDFTTAKSDPRTAGWRSDELTPPDGTAWDLLIIGGGTAGIVAAKTAAGFGANVLVVEAARTGGDCLWTGCVPSKALLAAAHAAADARTAVRYGVHVDGVRVDFGEVMTHVRATIETIEPDDSPDTLRAAGAHVAHGRAKLSSPDTAVIIDSSPGTSAGDGVRVRFRHALIATGSSPAIPPIPGLAEADPLTSDTIWSLTELPQRLLVLGGGSIGCELGQAFARLGSHVSILEEAPNLLPREDPHAASLLLAALADDGISISNGARLESVERRDNGWRGRTSSGSTIPFDRVLVAVGRTPHTADLGLEAAGVTSDDHGHVVVDKQLRTSNPRIWAAGDVTGHPQFTHVAGVHGSLATSNAILGLHRSVDTATIPRVTFTQPEVAAVGVAPDQAGAHSGLTVRTIDHTDLDRAVTEDIRRGVTRLVLDRRGRIVGATIVGPRAGESLAELVLAARQGLRARDLATAMHAYPTYGDGPWRAAIEHVQSQLHRSAPRSVRKILASLARRRAH
ncbi:oxidoreductase [Kribbella qitaiheensis]|uniref:Oxidoreductase n=1 Tax=Kribbella qitaiheensis TaxID=1544730 RepID=A0A7G6WW79_9ACTN|nr:FAD-dependent oxidoreductase [Kribbella qitaiheensis]QNE18244.1 oxidoreductase [Kribbella qitaiheensis]